MLNITKTGLFLALILGANMVSASPLLQEDFPWPNLPSLSFSSNGVNPGSATLEWTYSNLNPAEFDQLWWTPMNLGVGLAGIADPMLAATLTGGIATYTGSTFWSDPSGSGSPIPVNTRIDIEIVGLSLVSVVPIEISTAGLSPGPFAIDVSGLTGFTAKFTAQAQDPGSGLWIPVNNFNQPAGSSGQTQTSVGATFFRSAPASVPEPASLVLLGMGLLGLRFGKAKKLS